MLKRFFRALAILSFFFSTLGFAKELRTVLEEIAIEGEVCTLYGGSGIQISEDIILTVYHLTTENKNRFNVCGTAFEENHTVKTSESKYVEKKRDASRSPFKGEFRSVLVTHNSKNTYVVTKDESGYQKQKVHRAVSYNPNEDLNNDPIQVLLLSQNPKLPLELPLQLKDKVYNQPWNVYGRVFSDVTVGFSFITPYVTPDSGPLQLSEFQWTREAETFIHSPKGLDLFISSLNASSGMSGGGVFHNGKLFGIISSYSSKVKVPILPVPREHVDSVTHFLEKFHWRLEFDQDSLLYSVRSTPGVDVAHIKPIVLDTLVQAIRSSEKAPQSLD